MALNTKNLPQKENDNKFAAQPVIEAGVYPARIVQIIDLGLQPQRAYQGQEKGPVNEIMITYELVDTFCVDGEGNEMEDKPRWISETLPIHPLYADKAKSTKRYKAIDPNEDHEGDFTQLIEAPVNVTLVNNQTGDKVYTNVAAIGGMRPRDAQKCPELKNPAKIFDLDDPDMEVFTSLPQWVQDKIKANLEFNGSKLQGALEGEPNYKNQEKKKKPELDPAKEDIGDDDKPWD